MFTVILAETSREAARYARQANLRKGSFRYATRAATIKGLRVAEIHELPSYKRRRDRFAVDSALRWTKGKRRRVLLRAERYDDIDRCHGIALRYEALARGGQPEPASEPVPENAPQPAGNRNKAKAKAKAPAGEFF